VRNVTKFYKHDIIDSSVEVIAAMAKILLIRRLQRTGVITCELDAEDGRRYHQSHDVVWQGINADRERWWVQPEHDDIRSRN
jgi:hypothetical protein